MITQNFIHLRVHSSYSLSEGAVFLEDLVERSKKYNMPAVGVSDTNNLFASLEFSMKAVSYGVQPIIGCILNFDSQIESNIHQNKIIDNIFLIAKNKTGYQNLLRLASIIYLETKDHLINCINFDDLKKYSEGLIVLVGSSKSTIGRLFRENRDNKANEFLNELLQIFSDNLYIELMRHGFAEETGIEPKLIEAGLNNNIPFVATNDVYFLDKSMYEAHEVLLCIADGKYISEDNRRKVTPEHYFKTSAEMVELFADIPEAIENTIHIARRCSAMSESRQIIFPEYEVTVGKDEEDELRILAKEGLENRLIELDKLEKLSPSNNQKKRELYFERLSYELDVIIRMKFAGYFLIVSDFIRWSKKNDIPVGPGRGSGTGSVVAWSLDITDIDPIKFGLLFERFLNPERVSMPDFDIDFCQERREKVIEYVRTKYGDSRVAQIITFGKLQARAVVRDVGRVLQMPYSQVDRISKMIPFNAQDPVTLKKAIEMEPELKLARQKDPAIAKLLDISLKLEGLNRHASTHAAGIVISNEDLVEVVPLYKDQKSSMAAIQYSMKYAEAAGLIKFDFLGLKTLTVISKCVEMIHKHSSEFDIRMIPFDDKKTFDMLSKGDSVGVFQVESPGMKDALRKMKPATIYDIIALGALYRPGAMNDIPTYIACMHGKQERNYLHPLIKDILEETFGVIVYQEQVMEIAKVLSGYTLGAADLLRRAMGKKIKSEMDAQRTIFVSGAIKNGVSEEDANNIFDRIAKFAGYGFNKSHAAAYGLISYQTAYLKANYPAEMLVALLNNDIADTDKINLFIDEVKYFNISITRPDINKSNIHFCIEYDQTGKGQIIYGLAAVKNVGMNAMQEVVEERRKNGYYKDIFDFIKRSNAKVINKRQLESLIKAGCFDSIEPNRRKLFDSIAILANFHTFYMESLASNQISLFGDKTFIELPKLENVPDWSSKERLNNECLSLGFYLNDHPLDIYKNLFNSRNISDALFIKENLVDGFSTVKIVAIPLSVKTRVSPKGRYISCQMSTPTGLLDVAIFDDNLLEKNRDFLYNKVPLFIIADVKKDSGGARVAAREIKELEKYFAENKGTIHFAISHLEGVKLLSKFLENKAAPEGSSVKLIVKANNKNVEIYLTNKYKIDVAEFNDKNLPLGIESVEQV